MRLLLIDAGCVVNTHGLKGEIKIEVWLDKPDDLCKYKRVSIESKQYMVKSCRVQKEFCLLKLEGIDSIDTAEQYRGKTVAIFRDDIEQNIIFAAELIGVEVYNGETLIGTVEDILDYPGNKVYDVKGQYEYLIPAVKAFVEYINLEQNRMSVRLIEGMKVDEN